MANLETWVNESLRRGEKVVVVIRNETTGEEAETVMSPCFAAGLFPDGEIKSSAGGSQGQAQEGKRE